MSEITVVQLGELIAQAKAGRVTRENLQKFLLNPLSVNSKPNEYVVSVDYGMTVEQMVEAGHYDRKNSDINSRNFPVKGTGVVTVALELIHLNKVASSEAVLDYLETNGMCPATLEELSMFGATYPEVQREFPIAALGSSWVDPVGYRRVPYLGQGGFKRELDLLWFAVGWSEICRFLAVRK